MQVAIIPMVATLVNVTMDTLVMAQNAMTSTNVHQETIIAMLKRPNAPI